MRWLRSLLRRPRAVCPEHIPEPAHPLSDVMTQLIEQRKPLRRQNAIELALLTFENGAPVLSDDPFGLFQSLSEHTGQSIEDLVQSCYACARMGQLLGPWRLFLLDETLLGKRQQRLMASVVVYRSQSIPVLTTSCG